MQVSEITVRIRRFKEITETTDNPNIYNTCMNRLSVLEVMLERWRSDEASYTGQRYDKETDFRIAYQNTVDKLIDVMDRDR